jgi:hypothetical protein
MIYVKPGESRHVELADAAPPDLVGIVTWRLENLDDEVVLPPTTDDVREYAAGAYDALVTFPDEAGAYRVIATFPDVELLAGVFRVSAQPAPGEPIGLAPSALTTLEAVRSFLQTPPDKTAQDGLIRDLINRASEEISSHTSREFAPAGEAGEERQLLYTGGGYLDLDPYDVRTVTAVKLGTDLPVDQHVMLEPSDWRLRPVPAKDGVFQSIKLLRSPRSECEVTVTGAWGFPVVPANVEHWCIVAVTIWLRRDVAAFSKSLRLEEDRLEKPLALPDAVVDGLSKYTRHPLRLA